MPEKRTPIIIGSDHAAYDLKEKVKVFLIERGIDVEDVGCHSEDSVDYPDFGIKVASMPTNFLMSERLCVQIFFPLL
jgi:ribose 5-phosphate isomerase RpiB